MPDRGADPARAPAAVRQGVGQRSGGRSLEEVDGRQLLLTSVQFGRALRAAGLPIDLGAAIDFTAPADTYSVAMNDFMAAGGDGYPNFSGQFATLTLMLDDVIDYIMANTPITPTIQDRHVGDGFGPLL